MIERDYILRILQEFFDAISKIIRRKEEGEDDFTAIQKRFDEVYRQFFRSAPNYFYENDKETILEKIEDESYSERETEARLTMLSELLYQDALIKPDVVQRCDLLSKVLYLLEYFDGRSRTFSWEREQRKTEIRKLLRITN
ncbi:MAG: hypothetical protein LBD53_00160 [Tannerella sp.]|jgi:hypothetical protein|nr:hypothetical protein [Tannerella sp.]